MWRTFNQVGGVDVTTDSPFPKAASYNYEGTSPPSLSTIQSGETAFSQSDIDLIKANDSTGANPDETHHFTFSVSTSATQIDIHWRGQAEDSNDVVRLFAWNYTLGDWDLIGSITGNYWQWINGTLSNPSNYISSTGELHIIAVGDAVGLFESTGMGGTDYIEIVVTVPDTAVQTACVQYISGAPRNWDGIFDDDAVSMLARVTDGGGNPIANYPVYIKAEYDGGYGTFGGNWTNATGYANLIGKPIDGSVTDKWRVTLKTVIGDVMTNGVAYQAGTTCGEDVATQNVAITPGSYDIMLVGRYWDPGGGDWVRIRWIAEPRDVTHVNVGGYDIPAAQHFDDWDFLLWKIGIPDPNNDDSNQTEGVNGNTNDMNSNCYPACVGPDNSPYCPGMDSCKDGRTVSVLGVGTIGSYPPGCCYKDPKDAHNCSKYMSGYRFSLLMQFNLPDHALGEVGKSAMFICQEYDTLYGMLQMTDYSGHEGCGGGNCRIHCTACLWSVINIGQSPGATEYLALNGYTYLGTTIIRAWPNGGLGTLSFIGLAADNQHIVGLVLGHRWGIHPFVTLVTSMPSGTYPADTDTAGWQNFYPTWIYYLLKNIAYNIRVMGEELWHWKDRYPVGGEDNIVLANQAFDKLLFDFIPYLNETLWILQASGNNTVNTFISTTFTQLYDIGRIVKHIRTNATLRSEFREVIGTALTYLPNITGPVDGSTGLNYFLHYRLDMSYPEREDANFHLIKLTDQILSFIITTLKHIPIMEYDPNAPGWNFGNWISDY